MDLAADIQCYTTGVVGRLLSFWLLWNGSSKPPSCGATPRNLDQPKMRDVLLGETLIWKIGPAPAARIAMSRQA